MDKLLSVIYNNRLTRIAVYEIIAQTQFRHIKLQRLVYLLRLNVCKGTKISTSYIHC